MELKFRHEEVGTELTGPYLLSIRKNGRDIAKWDYAPSGARRINPQADEEETNYINVLGSLNLGIHILSADRKITSDKLEEWGEEMERHIRVRADPQNFSQIGPLMREFALQHALRNAAYWISRQAVQGTNIGSGNVNAIYTDIVKRVARSGGVKEEQPPSVEVAEKLITTLHAISERSTEYAKFELVSKFNATEMVAVLQSARGETLALVKSILEPYIEAAQARFEALRKIFEITEMLVNTMNDFYVDKSVSYGLTRGFRITTSRNAPLTPDQLSSGEQHLLLLFCHTLICRDTPSVFIIDEPELSLNIKWQRKLIQSLLNISKGSQTQFIFASHSIELLAQHKDRVVVMREDG